MGELVGIFTCVYIYIYICVCVLMYIYSNICVYIYMHTPTPCMPGLCKAPTLSQTSRSSRLTCSLDGTMLRTPGWRISHGSRRPASGNGFVNKVFVLEPNPL